MLKLLKVIIDSKSQFSPRLNYLIDSNSDKVKDVLRLALKYKFLVPGALNVYNWHL